MVFVVLCGLFLFFAARSLHLKSSDFTVAKTTANAAALIIFRIFGIISFFAVCWHSWGLASNWLAGLLVGALAFACLWDRRKAEPSGWPED